MSAHTQRKLLLIFKKSFVYPLFLDSKYKCVYAIKKHVLILKNNALEIKPTLC